MPKTSFSKSGTVVFNLAQVVWANFDAIEELKVIVKLTDGLEIEVNGLDAIEVAMLLKPSVMESKRLKWIKFSWMVHNIVGHPVMQLCALFGAYKLAFWVHDSTVPKPIGRK